MGRSRVSEERIIAILAEQERGSPEACAPGVPPGVTSVKPTPIDRALSPIRRAHSASALVDADRAA